LWAQCSENIAEVDPKIKYGNGHKEFQEILNNISDDIKDVEIEEENAGPLMKLLFIDTEKNNIKRRIASIIKIFNSLKQEIRLKYANLEIQKNL
jgi:hypothetical protein